MEVVDFNYIDRLTNLAIHYLNIDRGKHWYAYNGDKPGTSFNIKGRKQLAFLLFHCAELREEMEDKILKYISEGR